MFGDTLTAPKPSAFTCLTHRAGILASTSRKFWDLRMTLDLAPELIHEELSSCMIRNSCCLGQACRCSVEGSTRCPSMHASELGGFVRSMHVHCSVGTSRSHSAMLLLGLSGVVVFRTWAQHAAVVHADIYIASCHSQLVDVGLQSHPHRLVKPI